MTSTRPYLIRAFYEWIVDNGCTPHIVVKANLDQVQVPMEYVEDNQIVLNISPSAVSALQLGLAAVEFQARFGGKIRRVYAPIRSILAIYAKENGRGMVFSEEDIEGGDVETPPPLKTEESGKKGGGKKGKGGHLSLVKS